MLVFRLFANILQAGFIEALRFVDWQAWLSRARFMWHSQSGYAPSARSYLRGLPAAPRFARVVRSDRPRFARAHCAHVLATLATLTWARFARRGVKGTSVSSREFPTPGIPGKKLQKFFPRKTISREFPKNSRKTLFYLMNFVNHGGLYNFL